MNICLVSHIVRCCCHILPFNQVNLLSNIHHSLSSSSSSASIRSLSQTSVASIAFKQNKTTNRNYSKQYLSKHNTLYSSSSFFHPFHTIATFIPSMSASNSNSNDSSSSNPSSSASNASSADPSVSTSPSTSSSSSSTIYTGGKYRVYTKTGDKGTSSLFNSERRPKNDECFEALGDTDELNANIGVVRAHCSIMKKLWTENKINNNSSSSSSSSSSTSLLTSLPSDINPYDHFDDQLIEIQSRLFDIGAHLATPQTSSTPAQLKRTIFDPSHTSQLEQWIDQMEIDLPILTNFILPSGNLLTTHLHVCRAICRRAERRTIPLIARDDIDSVIQIYLNRLSDYLFVAARWTAKLSEQKETIWKKPRERSSMRKQQQQQTEQTNTEG